MMDKLYRPAVLLLLTVLVGLLATQTLLSQSGPSAACNNARSWAQTALGPADPSPSLSDYQGTLDVAKDNIDQQQFAASQFTALTLHTIAVQNQVIIRLLQDCH